MKIKYKIIVIGSGPGGSIPASMFAGKGHDVLLIEKGKYYNLNEFKSFSSDEMLRKYKNGGLTISYGKTKINYVEGMCAGGGSEVNSGLYHRLPEEILYKWEKKNNIYFDRVGLENCYKKNEKDLSISYLPNVIPKSSLKLLNGANKLNWKCREIPRWYKYDEKGKGVKQSMTETFIPDFIKNGGTLLSNSNVEKINKIGKRNIVHVVSDGISNVYESDYLFISAGAIDTPFLLQKSGYKGLIGKGLKTHPSFKFTAFFNEDIYSKDNEVGVHQIKEFSPKILMGCSVSNKSYIGLGLNETNNLSEINNWKKMSNYYTMISPEGEGEVLKLPFWDTPIVKHRLTKNDYHQIHKGIYLLAKLLFESGAIKLYPSIKKSFVINKLEDVYKLRLVPNRYLKLMTIHLFSSVQLSGNKNLGPLSPEGYLWEDKSIYVSDSSMLIDSPSVNPQGIIMALARMNGMRFLNRLNNEI